MRNKALTFFSLPLVGRAGVGVLTGGSGRDIETGQAFQPPPLTPPREGAGKPLWADVAHPTPALPIEGRGKVSDSMSSVTSSGSTTAGIDTFTAALPPTGRLIGIDGGTTTLGLALSDVSRTIASPLETIQRTKFKADAARLLALIAEHNVCGLVLGLPTNMNGSEGPRCQATRALARNLNALAPLPILLWDERLTTAAAERMLIEADTSRKRRSEVIDKLAATLILQGALDRLRNARF